MQRARVRIKLDREEDEGGKIVRVREKTVKGREGRRKVE